MRELELCSALVRALQQTRGYSAPQTVEAGARVHVLAEKVGNISQLFRQEESTWGAVLTTGDDSNAAAIANHLLDLAKRQGHHTEHLAFAYNAQVQAALLQRGLDRSRRAKTGSAARARTGIRIAHTQL
jgi:hypothetical protein